MKRKIKRIVLSYSVLNEYKTCETKFKYRYLEGLVRPAMPSVSRGSPLTFGSLAHKFLELYHGGTPASDALVFVLEEGSKTALAQVAPSELRSLLHLELLLNNYIQKYAGPNDGFKPITLNGKPALEPENDFLMATLPNGGEIIWRQHFDGIVTSDAGEPWILEHKTSSGNLYEDLVERMLPNDQVTSYVYGARKSLDLDVKGVLFNGLCTYRPLVNPGYKPKSGPHLPMFHRQFVPIPDWMIAEWETETMRTIKRLVEDIEDNVFSKKAPDSCTIWNTKCTFTELCKVNGPDRKNIADLLYEKLPWKGFQIELE